MNNKVKKGKHRHRYSIWSFNLFQVPPKVIQYWCKCGKERPLNNKVEG